jgi:micrococcal nuclease
MKRPGPPSATADIDMPAILNTPHVGDGRRARNGFPKAIWLPLLMLCFWGGEDLSADTIFLKNGTRIENVEAWSDGGLIRCFRYGSVIGYPREDVLGVMAGPVRPAPPEEKLSPVSPEDDAAVQATETLVEQSPGSFRMKHVFDGDSLKVTDGNLIVHIRIVGIDAPERGNRKKRTAGQPYSKKAADHLKRLISNRSIRIKGYGMDAYNRQLAEVFADGRNVGIDMLESGYAEVYSGKLPEGFDPRPYLAAEQRARKYGRGIWAQGRMYISPRKWRATQPR